MQNKGFVKVIAVLLTVVCAFYLSFSFVTRHHEKKAAQYAGGESVYIDSVMNKKVYLGVYTFKLREEYVGVNALELCFVVVLLRDDGVCKSIK